MGNPRRLLGGCFVLGSAAAACVGSLTLSSTSQESVIVSNSMYDFGFVMVGGGSTTNPDPYFTVGPGSSTSDDCVSVSTAPGCGTDFALTGSATPFRVYCVPLGASSVSCTPQAYQFGAKFTPTMPQMQSCTVNVESWTYPGFCSGSGSGTNGFAIHAVMLMGSGSGSSYMISADKSLLAFGSLDVGTTSTPQTVTVTNKGTTPLELDVADGANPAAYTRIPSATTFPNLPPGMSISFMVRCTPQAPNSQDGSLTFTSTPQSQTIPVTLTCSGVPPGLNITVNPDPIAFGNQLVGAQPSDRTVTISTTSTMSITLNTFATTGPDISFAMGNPGTGTIGAASPPFQTQIHYAAQTVNATGSLGSMTFDASGTMFTIPITGTLLQGSLGMTPSTVDFGPICIGDTATKDVMVYSNAAGTVNVSSIDSPAAPFTSTKPTGNVDATHSLMLTAKAQPVAATPLGDATSKVTLHTDIPNQPTYDLALHAYVLPGGISATPPALAYGVVAVGPPTAGMDVTLTNCGSADLTVTGATVDNPNDFNVVSSLTYPLTIATTASQKFSVQMLASTPGAKMGNLIIAYGGTSSMTPLSGTVSGGTGSAGGKDRETYYACSTGGSASVWPIGLALLALRRRRR